MKPYPSVLIVGRPNVGKSTLVNRMLRKQAAITLDEPGVTRDLIPMPTDWNGKPFLITDSGGVLFGKTKDIYLQEDIEERVLKAAHEASVILFVTDVREGVHTHDLNISRALRAFASKIIVVVNKVDDPHFMPNVHAFYELGLGKPYAVSSLHGNGFGDMLDEVALRLPQTEFKENLDIRVAIVGRPNVGKSSLVNAILNEKRMIVDNVAGTTRDSVDSYLKFKDDTLVLIDTAGIRKKGNKASGVEYYSILRSQRAIHGSDVVVVVVEPETLMCDQDKKIIRLVLDAHKPCIIFVNKWDITDKTGETQRQLLRTITSHFPPLEFYPILFGSAKDKVHLNRLLETIPVVHEKSQTRLPTSELNRFIEQAIKRNPPPTKQGERVKVLYATQTDTVPPELVFFVNNAQNLKDDYKRFLEKKFREYFKGQFEGVPLKFQFRSRA